MKERADMPTNSELNWDVLCKEIDQAWCKKKEEGHEEWHAYGECCFDEDDSKDCHCSGQQHPKATEEKKPEKRLLLMVEPDGNVPELVKSLAYKYSLSRNAEGKALYEIENMELKEHVERSSDSLGRKTDIIVAEPFQQPEAGIFYRPSTLLHPGARVFSTSPELGDSTNGTIGAFLKAKGTSPSHPAWLLSNKHVLLQQDQRLESVEVRGAGQTLISREVQFIGLRDTSNLVDAAIAKVIDSDEIEAIYDGIQIHCAHPMEPRLGMKAYKLGNATGITSGRIICRLNRVFVEDANKRGGGFEFSDQYLIGSDTTFMANGDSGSLVIGDGHPVALLFAMANKIKGLPKNMHFVPPFGLACSIVEVLDKLPTEGKTKWEIMLDSSHIKDCCCHPIKDCGCHEATCTCYRKHCLCHAEYCPYYCPCGAGQEKHEHCTCKSGHARHGKECDCEAYHANYGKKQPAGGDCQENGEANGPGGHDGGNGGANNPRVNLEDKNQERAREGGSKHNEKDHPHKG
ncbi:MAG TPA: hypothetical protein VI636_20930 [Candidatus Angelobacter sp.]